MQTCHIPVLLVEAVELDDEARPWPRHNHYSDLWFRRQNHQPSTCDAGSSYNNTRVAFCWVQACRRELCSSDVHIQSTCVRALKVVQETGTIQFEYSFLASCGPLQRTAGVEQRNRPEILGPPPPPSSGFKNAQLHEFLLKIYGNRLKFLKKFLRGSSINRCPTCRLVAAYSLD